jgi:hypothetical protein
MSRIGEKLRRLVIVRAENRCEYCRLAQEGQAATFHIDHIVPRCDGGLTAQGNLALACVGCSLRKGARRAAEDPATSKVVGLFHPRRDVWSQHFRWRGLRLVGLSAKGRTTIAALDVNHPRMLQIRKEEQHRGRHPAGR